LIYDFSGGDIFGKSKVRTCLMCAYEPVSRVSVVKCCYKGNQVLSPYISGTFLTCPRTTYKSRRVKAKGFSFLEQQRSERNASAL
jgi:hypothetical protein